MDEKWYTDDFESGSSANSDTPARRSISVYHLRRWPARLGLVLTRFGASWPEMRRKPGTDTNFRRSLPEFGCLLQGLLNGTGRPFVGSSKRSSTPSVWRSRGNPIN